MSQEDALSLVINRNFFYRDNFRRIAFLLVVSMVVNGCLGLVTAYAFFNQKPPQFIVSTEDGRLIPIAPLSQPVKSNPVIIAWANMAAAKINSLNFVDYKRQLQESSNFFTASGWRNYRASFLATGNLDYIIANKFVVEAVATGAPKITEQGLLDGRYTWRLSLQLLIKYQGAGGDNTQAQTVTMMIRREDVSVNPSGIGIEFYKVKQG